MEEEPVMTATSTSTEPTTAAPATRFAVACPYCASEDSTISIDLNNLDAVTCSGCDAEFTAAEAVDHLAGRMAEWSAVARWVALAGAAMGDRG